MLKQGNKTDKNSTVSFIILNTNVILMLTCD